MEDPQKNSGGGGKWIVGGIAVILAYGVGYGAGEAEGLRRNADPVAPAAAAYALPQPESTVETAATSLPAPPAPEGADDAEQESRDNGGSVDLYGEDEFKPYAAGPPSPPSGTTYATPGTVQAGLNPPPAPTIRPMAASTAAPPTSTGTVYPYTAPRSINSAGSTNGYPPVTAEAPAPVTRAPVVGGCAENGSCYGDISATTGRPRTVHVGGYYRRDGTYVRGHYRSRPRRR